jgi:hypothetical protein
MMIDPTRPADEQALLRSGAVYYFYACDTLVDGWHTSLNEVDGYPEPLFTSEPEGWACLLADQDVSLTHGGHVLEDYFIASSDTYLHGRRAVWNASGGGIEGDPLPVPEERRDG